jgi:hypothetical protein
MRFTSVFSTAKLEMFLAAVKRRLRCVFCYVHYILSVKIEKLSYNNENQYATVL